MFGAVQALQEESQIPTFRISAREVLIDVIALHGRGKIVTDLAPADLEVSESSVPLEQEFADRHRRSKNKGPAEPETITSLHLEDLDAGQTAADDGRGGFQIAASCLERSTQHYRLAFRPGPDGLKSGNHAVEISTTRSGVKLFYRHEYYVGLTEPPANPPVRQAEEIDRLLLKAACYYPDTPPSILLHARFVDSGRKDVLRASVAIDADSLTFVTLNGDAHEAGVDRHVALDYGICTFDGRGRPAGFFHAPLEKVLTSVEYARALDRGFPHFLDFPKSEHVALTRVVVFDRGTGNVGAVDIAVPGAEEGVALVDRPAAVQTEADFAIAVGWLGLGWTRENNPQLPMILRPPPGPIGSFGSIVAAPETFCGDVFELPRQTEMLPDFRELDPIGSIYSPTLDVPDQTFSNTSGIPGVTPRTNLFGIDYHGVFVVEAPGEYQFLMVSDDGAILRVDDKKVIDLDGLHMAKARTGLMHLDSGAHSIEVPYYQGAVNAVALELWVKPPGAGRWALFDMRDFSEPELDAAEKQIKGH